MHLETHVSESTLASLRRFSSHYTIGRSIKKAGGLIVERHFYFDCLVLLVSQESYFPKQWKYWMSGFFPNESHCYLITAQKKIRSAQVISLSNSIIHFSAVESNSYVKS